MVHRVDLVRRGRDAARDPARDPAPVRDEGDGGTRSRVDRHMTPFPLACIAALQLHRGSVAVWRHGVSAARRQSGSALLGGLN